MLSSIPYHRPATLTEALALAHATPGARFVAGGTDMMVKLRGGSFAPSALISLRNLPELRGVSVGPEGARIGAATPLAALLQHPELQAGWPLLLDALRTMGSAQIRNSATLGGNLCNGSPCADSPPALIALGARVELVGPAGLREVAVEDFFTGPGATLRAPDEALSAVLLDPPVRGSRGVFLRKQRVAMDLAQVNLAVWLALEGPRVVHARVVAGAVGPTPLRLRPVESLLCGEPTAERVSEAAALAAALVQPISDLRATAAYRRHITGVFVRRAVEACLEGRNP